MKVDIITDGKCKKMSTSKPLFSPVVNIIEIACETFKKQNKTNKQTTTKKTFTFHIIFIIVE